MSNVDVSVFEMDCISEDSPLENIVSAALLIN